MPYAGTVPRTRRFRPSNTGLIFILTCVFHPLNPEYLRSFQIFSGFRVAQSLVLCVVLCRSLFVLLSFFFWSLYCLSFWSLYCLSFFLRLLATNLVSSNFSTKRKSYLFSWNFIFIVQKYIYILYSITWSQYQSLNNKSVKEIIFLNVRKVILTNINF